MALWVVVLTSTAVVTFLIVCVLLRFWFILRRRSLRPTKTIAFFHPYCNAGGGGERVLWTAIRATRQLYPTAKLYVYTGDSASPTDILSRARERFNETTLEACDITFLYLRKRHWVEADRYPYFTMLGQSLGSIVLGFEALTLLVPHMVIDTMGYAFTYPLFKWIAGCERVAAYVHYPTISTDMLLRVAQRTVSYNNRSSVAKFALFSTAKLLYYRLFAALYGFVGRRADLVMVNSSWTRDHIVAIWKPAAPVSVVWPPVDTASLRTVPLDGRQRIVISIGQFRPEKDHALQLRSFALFRKHASRDSDDVQLVLIGSCRDATDTARVEQLHALAGELGLHSAVLFELNVSHHTLRSWLARAMVGLHTMWCEHFGIGIVELMAAGVIPVAHDSGGPRADIVVPWNGAITGFLATTEGEYAAALDRVLNVMTAEERRAMQEAARASSERFSEEQFVVKYQQALLRRGKNETSFENSNAIREKSL